MVYTFDDPRADGRHKVQYFEMIGNRAIYADGWFAGTIHKAPWEAKPRAALLDDKWELYDTRTDFSLVNDLATKNPAKLKEMQELFLKEAVKYNVLPLDDRKLERFNAALVGRPDLMAGRTSLTVYEGMTGMSENVFVNTKNRSHSVTAEVQVPEGGAGGVSVAQAAKAAFSHCPMACAGLPERSAIANRAAPFPDAPASAPDASPLPPWPPAGMDGV